MTKARIFNTHRMASDDGPGLRTTLFLKGCPLNCLWCHNPESISPLPEVWWFEKKCIFCGMCLNVCNKSAISFSKKGITINKLKCSGCGNCASVCPSKAIEFIGREWSVAEAFEYVMKDKMYYATSGGGVTLSGGEPTLKHQFAYELFEKLVSENVHTAIDTCGLATVEVFERLMPVTRLFLWDIKVFDSEKHKEFTEVPNDVIMNNLMIVAEKIRNSKETKLWIRTPLIPLMTATEENLTNIADFINRALGDVVERWEICAFNSSCRPKYERLDLEWKCEDLPTLNKKDIFKYKKLLSSFFPLCNNICFSGFVKD